MPGSGKSTIGKLLAEALKLSFIDLDHEIENFAGCSIKKLFATKGEDYFRQVEHETLVKVASGSGSAVIATGGGTPAFFNNMSIIRAHGESVFINPPLTALINRMLEGEVDKRPKFSGGEVKEVLSKLMAERLPYYEQADYKWEGQGSIEDLIKIIRSKESS